MRIVFLYVQSRHGLHYAERIKEEGYFYLIQRMVETGIVDNALILIESIEECRLDYVNGTLHVGLRGDDDPSDL